MQILFNKIEIEIITLLIYPNVCTQYTHKTTVTININNKKVNDPYFFNQEAKSIPSLYIYNTILPHKTIISLQKKNSL